MESLNEFVANLKSDLGLKNLEHEYDIFEKHGVVGDDFHELMELLSKKYKIDMAEYLWYFHSDEEGLNFGGLFFKPPYERVNRIPVTPKVLYEAAKAKRWLIEYPEHSLPEKRTDLLIGKLVFFGLVIVIIGIVVLLQFIK